MLIEYDKIFILYVYMFKCVCMLALIWQFQFFMLAQPLLYALFFCFALLLLSFSLVSLFTV